MKRARTGSHRRGARKLPRDESIALRNRLAQRLTRYHREEARVRELQGSLPAAGLYAAVVGAELGFDSYEIADALLLRRLLSPPGCHHVRRTDSGAGDGGQVAYLDAPSAAAELAVGDPNEGGEEGISRWRVLAGHTVTLLKLRGYSCLHCPFSASVSMDAIPAAADRSVRYDVLDGTPDQFGPASEGSTVAIGDAEWVGTHLWDSLSLLVRSRRFAFAFTSALEWNHNNELRGAMASAWAALEALFGNRSDRWVTASLADRIAGSVEFATPADVRELYRWRCDVVHGRAIAGEGFTRALESTIAILYRALVLSIEANDAPLPDTTWA